MHWKKHYRTFFICLIFTGCHNFTTQPIDNQLQNFGFNLHIKASLPWQKHCKQDTALIIHEQSPQPPKFVLIPFSEQPNDTASIKTTTPYKTILAFCDSNNNHKYDSNELTAAAALHQQTQTTTTVILAPSKHKNSQEIPNNLQSINQKKLNNTTQAKAFNAQNSHLGLWQPAQFARNNFEGLYLPKSDARPQEIVIFIHGINSSPAIFKAIADRLKKNQRQSAYFYYASGYPLEHSSRALYTAIQQLENRYKKVHLLAHSMGGLVTRNALNYCALASSCNHVATFTSISTPWLGHNAAASGVKYAPNIVPVWHDMAPHSEFLNQLFTKSLPSHIKHTLIFGFRQKDMLGFQTNDGVVSLQSMLAPIAQQQAYSVKGLNEDHTSILSSDALYPFLTF